MHANQWRSIPRDDRGVPATRWQREKEREQRSPKRRLLNYVVHIPYRTMDMKFPDDVSARAFGRNNPQVDRIEREGGTVIYYKVEQ